MEARRLGCLFIPDFRIQLHCLDEALDEGEPLVLVVRKGRGLCVEAVNEAAAAAGVETAMLMARAQDICPDVVIREVRPDWYNRESEALLRALNGITPMVEAAEIGTFFLGTTGIRLLYRDERGMLEAALSVLLRRGFRASAGGASNRFVALTAARVAQSSKILHVPSGGERSFLSPLPLTFLPLTSELLERLRLLGIETIGRFAALSPASVERRYGAFGLRMHKLARGDDGAYLVPTPLHRSRTRSLLLDPPVAEAEGVLFLLKSLVTDLVDELMREGWACRGMVLSLGLDDRSTVEIPIQLAWPLGRKEAWLEAMRLKLSRLCLNAGIVRLSLEATHLSRPSVVQTELFAKVGSPMDMTATLIRLSDALGDQSLSIASLVDGWCPEHSWTPLAVEKNARILGAPLPLSRNHRGCPPLSPRLGGDEDLSQAFRRLNPPAPIEVEGDDCGIRALVWGRLRRKITSARGPFRYTGHWWKTGYARDYYELDLNKGERVLVYKDLISHIWYIDGIYD